MTSISITDLENAKLDVDHIATLTTSTATTATDRLGHIKSTLYGAVETIKSFNSRGAWVALTFYAIKDLVSNSGSWYVCVTAHTSTASFATDFNANWRLYQGITSGDLASGDGASMVGFTAVDGGIVRNVENKLRENKSVLDFGAVGDGFTDDTLAVLAANDTDISLTLRNFKYLFDISSYVAGGGPVKATDNTKISDGGIKVKTGSYFISSPGAVDYYGMWGFSGNNSLAFNLDFDGNGQATYTAYDPAGPNIFMIPIYLGSTGKTGQKAIANAIDSNGGHAIEGANGNRMLIALNTASQHNGIGTTGTTSLAITGNVSENTSDSHYFANTVTNTAITGNVGTSNVNGGGIDLAGAVNTAATGNVITGSRANGIWPLKSPNTSTVYSRILISGNLIYNNCTYPNNEQGEIQIGDYNNLSEVQGTDVSVIGNYISPQDTPSLSGYNKAVWIHAKTTNTAILGNVIAPDPALITANQPVIQDKGSTFPVISGNVCFSSVPGTVYFDAAPVGQAHYANNVNLRISPASVGIPSAMESSDAVWNYHIVRPLTKAGKTLIDIFYTPAYCFDKIEILISNANNNGFLERHIVAQGAVGFTTNVLSNVAVLSLGAHPPTASLDVTVAGRLRITAATAAAGFDNEACGFFIRIMSSADTPSRFVPIFT